jgi:hypothetical protein
MSTTLQPAMAGHPALIAQRAPYMTKAAWPQSAKALMSLPFDNARAQYAHAVRAGLLARSLLASARFERSVDALERLAYGPFARRV